MIHDQAGHPAAATPSHEIDGYLPGAFRLGDRRWDVVGGDETDGQVTIDIVVVHPDDPTLMSYVTVTVPISVVGNIVTVGEATVRRA